MDNEEISKIVIQFEESINGALQYKEELIQAFKQYIQSTIEELTSYSSANANNKDLIRNAITEVAQRLIDSPIDYKRKCLIRDESMETLINISDRIFQAAVDVKTGSKGISINIEKTKEELRQLLQQVQPWNKTQAANLVSETELDLGVIQNPNTNIVSIRLGRIMNVNQKIQEEGEGR